jgi:hypothetical protein
MRTRRRRWTDCIALGLLGLAPPVHGQDAANTSAAPVVPAPAAAPAAAIGAWPTLPQAVQAVKQTGTPLVVIATSRAVPASAKLVASIKQTVASRPFGGTVLFVEMPAEVYGDRLKSLGIDSFPRAIVYRAGPKGLVAVGSRGEFTEGEQVISWLRILGLVSVRPPGDSGLVRTGGQAHYPTSQGPVPSGQNNIPPTPPPAPQPPPYIPQPVPAPPPSPVAPVYMQPAPQPLVVSAPSAPVVFQPSAPTIIVGPTPQPNIVFANAPASAPNISVMNSGNAPTAGNAPPQLFLAPQPSGNAPTQPPPMAYAPQPPPQPQPMAYAPQPPQQPAYAPVAFAPTGNSPALVTALLTNPRLWERLIGALGEHLAQKKNPRIQMGNAPVAQAPTQYGNAPTVGAPTAGAPTAYAPVAYAPSGYAPVAQPMYAMPAPPPMYMAVMPPQAPPMYAPPPAYQPPPYQPPPPPYQPSGPSPQGDGNGGNPQSYPAPPPPAKPSLFHQLFRR